MEDVKSVKQPTQAEIMNRLQRAGDLGNASESAGEVDFHSPRLEARQRISLLSDSERSKNSQP